METTQAELDEILAEILEADEVFYDGIAEEVYAQVTFKDGRTEKWDVSLISDIGQVDMITDPNQNRYHQFSELKALGIVDIEIRFIHKVFGFAE